MPKILWLGDAGSTTGFARVTHAIGDRLARDYGHEVHTLAVNYDGDAGKWDTAMKLYLPTKYKASDMYGQSRYVELLGEIMPDVVVILNDPYVVLKFLLRNKFDTELMLARVRPIIAYMPVDGTNQPGPWARINDILQGLDPVKGGTGPNFIPVAMTKFGQEFLQTPHMVYHGIDHETYRPVSMKDPLTLSSGDVIRSRGDAKEAFGIPRDAFLVLRVDRNSHRKNFGDTWRALVPVMKRHKDVYAWFHCKAEGDSLELPSLFSREPEIAGRFRFPGSFSTRMGWKEEDLIGLYNAADVFVSTSWGEGFGLTLGEAAACQVPIIAQNVSAIPEVVGPGGILLEPERLTAVDSGQDQWLPDVPAFTDAIEQLYMSKGQRRSLGEAGRKHVVDTFGWDEAGQKFHELITATAQSTTETSVPDLHGETDAPHDESAA